MPDAAPGSGALNAGYAVTYGDLGETNRMNLVNLLDQQNEQKQQRLLVQQQNDAAHKLALQRFYGDKFDHKNFDTKTNLDIEINGMGSDATKEVSDLIAKGANQQDIDKVVDQRVAAMKKLSQTGLAIRRNIDAEAQHYKDVKGIDVGLGTKLAEINALYKKDKNGNLVFKDPDELPETIDKNYLTYLIENFPAQVAKGDVDYNGLHKSFPEVSKSVERKWSPSPGVSKTESHDLTYRDGIQKLVHDANGYHVETASEPLETTDANGNKVTVNLLPESTVQAMEKDPGVKANIAVQTMKYLASHPSTANQDARPNTPAFDTAKRAMLYEVFSKFNPVKSTDKNDQTNSAALERMRLGYPMPGSGQKTLTPEEQNAAITASFNDITGVRFIGNNGAEGRIENGKLVGFKGGIKNLFNGGVVEGKVPIEQLPLSLMGAVSAYAPNTSITGKKYIDEAKEAGYDQGKQMQADADKGMVDVKVKNGVVIGIRTDNGPYFSVDDKIQSQINIDNKLRSIKNKIQPKKNDNSYYNDPDNVSNNSGDKITYRDGTIWQISGGKLKQIK